MLITPPLINPKQEQGGTTVEDNGYQRVYGKDEEHQHQSQDVSPEINPEFTIACEINFETGRNGRKKIEDNDAKAQKMVAASRGRIPRISKLMALAIHFESLIKGQEVQDYADIARLGGVSRARVTQIMNLLLLAPDIQEKLLFLPRVYKGRDKITERGIRDLTREPIWERQQEMWAQDHDHDQNSCSSSGSGSGSNHDPGSGLSADPNHDPGSDPSQTQDQSNS